MLILASASPRRREILEGLGVDIRIVCADTDESSDITDPERLTTVLAERKGRAVYQKLLEQDAAAADDAVIISADTVVALEDRIFGKPASKDEAMEMIRAISGGTHHVITGVAVCTRGKVLVASCKTMVHVDDIPEEEIERYVESGEPMDKAGGYAIQGHFSPWIRGIEGCYFNVVGLPVNLLNHLVYAATGRYLLCR